MSEKYIPVTFENSLGETISNDPIFLAQRTLKAAGLTGATRPDDHDEYMPTAYDELSGKDLKALALERGVDITGLKTVGQVREALTAADEAATTPAAADTEE